MKERALKTMISLEDRKQVLDLINEYKIKIPNIHLNLDNGKYIAGMVGNNISKDTKKYFLYNRFIESINDLSEKARISIEMSLDYFHKMDISEFSLTVHSINDKMACYYLENALYREISLWDSLAQLYNLYFNLNKKDNDIHYRNIINELKAKENSKNSRIDFDEISKYVFEKNEDLSLDIGIHNQICALRHQMTHRYSITITSMIEPYYLRVMPDTIYKIAKDYNMVHKFLIEIIDLIIEEIITNKTIERILAPLD